MNWQQCMHLKEVLFSHEPVGEHINILWHLISEVIYINRIYPYMYAWQLVNCAVATINKSISCYLAYFSDVNLARAQSFLDDSLN